MLRRRAVSIREQVTLSLAATLALLVKAGVPRGEIKLCLYPIRTRKGMAARIEVLQRLCRLAEQWGLWELPRTGPGAHTRERRTSPAARVREGRAARPGASPG